MLGDGGRYWAGVANALHFLFTVTRHRFDDARGLVRNDRRRR